MLMDEKLNQFTPSERTKVKRLSKRADYNTNTIHSILDEAFICQIGFTIENQIYITPFAYGRVDNKLYFHGAKTNRTLNSINNKSNICVSVTFVDGLVLARSAFHHSLNYRSVILFGTANEIIAPKSKMEALKVIIEHIIPGRWNDVRPPSTKELNATSVFEFNIEEASAKVRTGPAVDEKEDMELDVWAGILPFEIIHRNPERDAELNENIRLPKYIENYNRTRK
jgi:nitroimidazol reductase NimA-like FMN-containing flavoprotein (pyridoxamine 5'-phosphate oxidase superfamily)